MGYVIGNIYVITTVAVIGGALFGFDIASMSAMYVSHSKHLTWCRSHGPNLANLSFPALELSSTSASSIRPASPTVSVADQHLRLKVASRLPCRVVPLSAHWYLVF